MSGQSAQGAGSHSIASDDACRRVLLVDLCGTLYDSNTTFDFLRFHCSAGTGYRRFETLAGSLPLRVLNRLWPGDVRRTRAVAFLRGHDRTALAEAAHEFLSSLAPIEDVVRLVERLRAEHDRTFIVSSSLDFIVADATRRLGFDGGFGSTLGYDGDTCTGTIERDLLGRKHALIGSEFGGSRCTLVTDNRSDAPCRRLVDRFIGVAPAVDSRALHYWSNRVGEVVAYR